MKVIDKADATAPKAEKPVIGIRRREKIHEVMVSKEDSIGTFDYGWYYKILPTLNNWHRYKERIKEGIKVPAGFIHSGGNNAEWMTKGELSEFLNLEQYLELEKLNS